MSPDPAHAAAWSQSAVRRLRPGATQSTPQSTVAARGASDLLPGLRGPRVHGCDQLRAPQTGWRGSRTLLPAPALRELSHYKENCELRHRCLRRVLDEPTAVATQYQFVDTPSPVVPRLKSDFPLPAEASRPASVGPAQLKGGLSDCAAHANRSSW